MAAAHVIHVFDPADPRLADYVRLTDANLRRTLEAKDGLYLAEGDAVLARALDAGHKPRSVFVTEQRQPTLASLPLPPDIPCYVVPDDMAEAVTGFHVHRGLIAAMHRPSPPNLDDVVREARRIVVLEDLTNHTNVGALFRSAAAMGADAVLITQACADPLYRRAVRVSMGTVFQVPWTRITPWPRGMTRLRDLGFTIAAFDPAPDSIDLDTFAADPPERIAMIFGTEQAGIRPATRVHADVRVRIPMQAGVSSLNAAAAGAVAMWALRTGTPPG